MTQAPGVEEGRPPRALGQGSGGRGTDTRQDIRLLVVLRKYIAFGGTSTVARYPNPDPCPTGSPGWVTGPVE